MALPSWHCCQSIAKVSQSLAGGLGSWKVLNKEASCHVVCYASHTLIISLIIIIIIDQWTTWLVPSGNFLATTLAL